MKLIKVAAAALNQTPLDWDGNVRRILRTIERARDLEVGLLCLPELAVTGYGCEDAFHSTGVQRAALDALHEIVPSTSGICVALGLPLQFRKALFNVVAFVADGKIHGFTCKRHLAGDGVYYEPRWFKPWPEGRRNFIEIDGESYPLGDIYFVVDGINVGFEICEDAWEARRPGSAQAARGVDVLLNPSASHFAFGRHDIRRRFVSEGSRAFGVSYVYANHLGCDAGRLIFDGGTLIASGGRMLAEGPRFTFSEQELTCAVIDIDETRTEKIRTGSYVPDLEPHPGDRVKVEVNLPKVRYEPPPGVHLPAWERGPYIKEEEFTRAVTLGLFDYMRRSFSRGFVVSLSGGADSAAVSCLVSLMVHRAIAELGEADFLEHLAHIDFAEAQHANDFIRRLLICVYQSTRNSSSTTRDAARAVAEGIGAEFLELDVDPLVESYKKMIAAGLGRNLTWERDDVALQNIQARARGPSVWMLANIRGALLLTTSNRSEAAVGYATMDGDTCGGLSPIGGIDKAFLRRWLRWMETDGPEGLPAIPELAMVNVQAPTAELRPHDAGQTDEDDLMPYDLLDAIEGAAIRDKKIPIDVYETIRLSFPQYRPQQLGTWVERFFRLWCRNQWKRERYAPSFHLDDKNLDPKTWCRFPILSGGFERELEELRRHVAAEVG